MFNIDRIDNIEIDIKQTVDENNCKGVSIRISYPKYVIVQERLDDILEMAARMYNDRVNNDNAG